MISIQLVGGSLKRESRRGLELRVFAAKAVEDRLDFREGNTFRLAYQVGSAAPGLSSSVLGKRSARHRRGWSKRARRDAEQRVGCARLQVAV